MWGLVRVAVVLGLAIGATDQLRSESDQDDPRVRALVEAYGHLVDSVVHRDGDVVFVLGPRHIHFQDGRMLEAGRLENREECDPIFYRYSLDRLTEPLPGPVGLPTYCDDWLESLWGRSEVQIREHGRSVRFLDHPMFVNEIVVGPLAAVEGEILRAATRDGSVSDWIERLEITYSFSNRDIAGSDARSRHSWGMAVDLVPSSYEGLHVYWRWSRVFDREGWYRIPVERRWSPPQPVIEIFEQHGFIWGGKWAHFDAIHFEYRPEILIYNRLAEQ
jgi:hypothetical protein